MPLCFCFIATLLINSLITVSSSSSPALLENVGIKSDDVTEHGMTVSSPAIAFRCLNVSAFTKKFVLAVTD